jgi:hypothetical protein
MCISFLRSISHLQVYMCTSLVTPLRPFNILLAESELLVYFPWLLKEIIQKTNYTMGSHNKKLSTFFF